MRYFCTFFFILNLINLPNNSAAFAANIEEGEKISSNQIVMKMEAMKMENDIKSERDGIVEKIHVKQGDAVLENSVLISLGKG